MRSVLKKTKNKAMYWMMMACCGVILSGANLEYSFAADGLDNFIAWLCPWIIKIGLIIAMVGGLQVAIGFKQEDPDAKVRGLQTLAAGFMVAGIGTTPSIFGL